MSELDWTGITIDNGQCEHPDCPWCAQIWLRWYIARMGQMHTARNRKEYPSGYVREKETVSFAEAAATSNIPPKED